MSASVAGSRQTAKSHDMSQMAQYVNAPQNAALANLYGVAQQVFNNNQGTVDAGRGVAQQNAQNVMNTAMPAWQNQLNGGAYQDIDAGGMLTGSLNHSLNSPTNTQSIYNQIMGGQGNTYADAMKASYIGDANRTMDNMMRTLDARATGSGMSGGSRHGLATAQGMYDINSNLQHNLAQTGYNTFDKDLANKLQIAQQADSNTLARQQMLADMIGAKNNTTNGALQFGEGMQNLGLGVMAPASAAWGNVQGLTNAIGAPTILNYGNSQGFSKQKGMSQSASGSIGGKGGGS